MALVPSPDSPSDTFARTVSLGPFGEIGECIARFHFGGRVEGVAFPSLSAAEQDAFVAGFRAELDRLRAWCEDARWFPDACPVLQIWVSDEYKISKALIPAAIGRRGRIEFPAWKIVAGEAAVAHELAHVFFPNGNRLLAEGFAIYVQARLGGNPAFPNFGRPLHDMAIEVLRKMVPQFASGEARRARQRSTSARSTGSQRRAGCACASDCASTRPTTSGSRTSIRSRARSSPF